MESRGAMQGRHAGAWWHASRRPAEGDHTMATTRITMLSAVILLALVLGGCPTSHQSTDILDTTPATTGGDNVASSGNAAPAADGQDTQTPATTEEDVAAGGQSSGPESEPDSDPGEDPDAPQGPDPGQDADVGEDPDPGQDPVDNPDDVAPVDELTQPRVFAPLLFNAGKSVSVVSDELIELLAEAVFEAADQNGGLLTLSGTLTQTVNGATETWTYAAAPADSLVVQLANGVTTEFVVTRLDGETGHGPSGLAWGRHELEFDAYRAGICSLHIHSSAEPTVAYTSSWERHLTGAAALRGYTGTVDLLYTGERFWQISGVYEDLSDQAHAQGTVEIGDLAIHVDDAFYFQYYSKPDFSTANFSIGTAASAEIDGQSYTFDWDGNRAGARWEGTGQLVVIAGVYSWIDFSVYDDAYWLCGGSLYAGAQRLGDVVFSGPVTPYTAGPDLLLRLTDGTNVTLNDLLAE
jgi:hypothetical protein